ncbi:MAG: hypothetical protein U0235_14570 [Polyangiaceae bacterium]
MLKNRRGSIIASPPTSRAASGMVHTGAARGRREPHQDLAVEWVASNVRINCVAPGIIKSTGTDQYPQELVEMSRLRTPMKDTARPTRRPSSSAISRRTRRRT